MTNAKLTARVAQVEQQVRDCLADLAKADTSRVNAAARVKTLEDALKDLIWTAKHISSGRGSHIGFKRIVAAANAAKQALAAKEPKA